MVLYDCWTMVLATQTQTLFQYDVVTRETHCYLLTAAFVLIVTLAQVGDVTVSASD